MTDYSATVETTPKGIKVGIRVGTGGAYATFNDAEVLDLIDRLQGALVFMAVDRRRQAEPDGYRMGDGGNVLPNSQ